MSNNNNNNWNSFGNNNTSNASSSAAGGWPSSTASGAGGDVWSAPVRTTPSPSSMSSTISNSSSHTQSSSGWGVPASSNTNNNTPATVIRVPGGINRARSNSDLPKRAWEAVPGWSTGSSQAPPASSGKWGAPSAPLSAQSSSIGLSSGGAGWGSMKPEGTVGGWGSRSAVPEPGGWGRVTPPSGGFPSSLVNPTANTNAAGGWGRPPPSQQPTQSSQMFDPAGTWGRAPNFASGLPFESNSSSNLGGGSGGWGKPPAAANAPSTAVTVAPGGNGNTWNSWNAPPPPSVQNNPAASVRSAGWGLEGGHSLGGSSAADWGAPPSSYMQQNQLPPTPTGWGDPPRTMSSSNLAALATCGTSRQNSGGSSGLLSPPEETGWGNREIRRARSSSFTTNPNASLHLAFQQTLTPHQSIQPPRQPAGPPSSPAGFNSTLSTRKAVTPIPPFVPAAAIAEKEKEPAAANPMRLFNRSFNEVNKSLGIAGSEDVKLRRTNRSDRSSELDKAVGVYVYGFPKWVRVREILEVFSEYGAIVNVGIVSKPKKDQRAYAYVDYESLGMAARAIENLKGRKFFDMSEPLELRPHFDRKASDEASTEVSATTSADSNKKDKTPLSPVASNTSTAGSEKGTKKAAVPSSSATAPTTSKERIVSPSGSAPAEETNKRTLHIANVPQNVDKVDIEKLFHPFGEIRRIHIVQRPKERRAFAFISFKTEESAQVALRSVREGKHLGMTEPLKIEFSKADTQKDDKKDKDVASSNKGKSAASSAAGDKPSSSSKDGKERALDKPWKKGADLAKLTTTPAAAAPSTISSIAAGASKSKKSGGRTTIFVREVPDGLTMEDLQAKFAAVGTVRACHVVERVNGIPGRCAVVAFEKGDDASAAVKDKIESAMFPRQRRLTILDLPVSTVEADLRAFFTDFGEVRRVEIFNPAFTSDAASADPVQSGEATDAPAQPDANNTVAAAEADASGAAVKASPVPTAPGTVSAEVEFARGDVAIVVLLRLLSSGCKDSPVRAGYSPSSTASGTAAGGEGVDTDAGLVTPISGSHTQAGSAGAGEDGDDEHDEDDSFSKHSVSASDADSAAAARYSLPLSDAAVAAAAAAVTGGVVATASATAVATADYSSSDDDETDVEVVQVSMMDLDVEVVEEEVVVSSVVAADLASPEDASTPVVIASSEEKIISATATAVEVSLVEGSVVAPPSVTLEKTVVAEVTEVSAEASPVAREE